LGSLECRLREQNLAYIRYDAYLAKGWPIRTGVVEGAGGHLVKDWMEQVGMRWTQTGASPCGRGDRPTGDAAQWRLGAYWQVHRQQQHQRLYGTLAPAPVPRCRPSNWRRDAFHDF
jgi:hypothetical protein